MKKGIMMKKSAKIVIGVCAAVLLCIVAGVTVFCLWMNGVFDPPPTVTDVASFESPDGSFRLQFQQIGEPVWSFGKTNVRLILRDRKGNELDRIDTSVQNDGGGAYADNVRSVEWADGSVTVTLCAMEMRDQSYVLREADP